MIGREQGDRKPGRLEAAVFAVLVLLYIAAAIVNPRLSRSEEMMIIGRSRLPVSAFAGVLSSVSNLCLIGLVLYFRKPGFIAALCLLLAQFPLMVRNILLQRSLSSMPGLFISLLTLVAIFVIRARNLRIEKYRQEEVRQLRERHQLSRRLFEQTVAALVTAVDAKDEYSHGHSLRVAGYAEQIARNLGKSDEECRQVYYAGLLHDVGKIGMPDAIIRKKSGLTSNEYEEVKLHPVLGSQILSSIQDFPFLETGAKYHHERYDGTGYPAGLKGEEIPEIARIISVADTYDTLSSTRSYRSALPQAKVRQEIAGGAGTQFDPKIAAVMLEMIDRDPEYQMRESPDVTPRPDPAESPAAPSPGK